MAAKKSSEIEFSFKNGWKEERKDHFTIHFLEYTRLKITPHIINY